MSNKREREREYLGDGGRRRGEDGWNPSLLGLIGIGGHGSGEGSRGAQARED